MTPISLSAQSIPSSPLAKAETAKQNTSQVATATAAPAKEGTPVSISGRAVMLSRLFRTTDPDAEPPIEHQATISNQSGSIYRFLNGGDREVISKLYEYASANGIDPIKVDNLAFDLGIHRIAGPGGNLDAAGSFHDEQGNVIIAKFNAKDEAIAQRILTSKAIGDTAIDHGFLQEILTPSRAPTHATDFEFLQQVVFAFSQSGSDGSADPSAAPVIRPKKEDFPPLKMDQADTRNGIAILQSRLFPDKPSSNPADASAFAKYLTETDKNLLANLYAVTEKQNGDLTKVDKLAATLGSYRMREQMVAGFLNTRKV